MTRQELVTAMLTRPPDFGYHGNLDLFNTYGFTPFSVNRDSALLDRSNWIVIHDDLMARFPDSFEVVACKHWACGWIEHLAINVTDEDAVDAAIDWYLALKDYPIADEGIYSQMESDAMHTYWTDLSLDERIEICKQEEASIFAARRDYYPEEADEYLSIIINE